MTQPTRIWYGRDSSQFADLRVPPGSGPHPLVICVHGGFWRARFGLQETEAIACDLTRIGYATWNIEFRRVGQIGGGWPGTLQDVADAADCLVRLRETWPIDLRLVVSLGHSAGGHLALWLAARHRLSGASGFCRPGSLRIAGVVSLAGVCDLVHMAGIVPEHNPVVAFLGGTVSEFPERYAVASPANLLPLSVPQVLVHGNCDDRVPFEIGSEYARRGRDTGDDVTFIPLPGVGHFEFLDVDSAAWARSRESLQQLVAHLREVNS